MVKETVIKIDNPFDHQGLRGQIKLQREHAWDLESAVDWQLGVDCNKFLLPLDEDAIAFPGATPKQSLALSQLMGLLVNSTISEVESVAHKLRNCAWSEILRSYPINPEMVELGELFFAEEFKHAAAFSRYIDCFCTSMGIKRDALESILPKAYGSIFQKAIKRNAKAGGHAFWWVVGVLEEESVLIYQQIYKHRKQLDPLFFQLHRKHFEEESRHTNYAFLMLEVIKQRNFTVRRAVHQKIDLLYSELFSTGWVIAELHKVLSVKQIADQHPFFETLASCIPLFEKLSIPELARRMFISAPYISSILNRRYHRLTSEAAKEHKALGLIYPKPTPALIYATTEDVWSVA